MQRTVFIFINGIFTKPADAEGWVERAVTWVNTRLPDGVVGDRFEYWTTAWTRWIKQAERAENIAKKVGYYKRAGYLVSLVSHSNGGDLTARVLDRCGADIFSAHLFAPAAFDEDYHQAVLEGRVKRVHVYGSRNDRALRFAKLSRDWVLRWVGLGFGSLGLRGAELAEAHPELVRDHSNDLYDHGTWFQRGAVFEKTMRLLAANHAADLKEATTNP